MEDWPMPKRMVADEAGRRTAILANAEIRLFADENIDRGAVWEFFCECGCRTLVSMTIAAYDASRGGVWAPGHGRGPASDGLREAPASRL